MSVPRIGLFFAEARFICAKQSHHEAENNVYYLSMVESGFAVSYLSLQLQLEGES